MRLFLSLLILPVLSHAGITASEGAFKDKIILSWGKAEGAAYYTVQRLPDTPYLVVKGKDLPVEPTMLTQTKALSYTDLPSPPGRQKYVVSAYDASNQILRTEEGFGWRQVSDREFFLEFQKGIDSSLPRIRSMKQLNFWGEKVEGWRKGGLVYKTSGIFRRPIRITITYTNFTDQYLRLTGVYEVQIFKIIGQKGKLVGTIEVDGIYKGSITHDLVILKGQSSEGGVYRVRQNGGAETVLPWNIATHPLDDARYESNLQHTMKDAKKEGVLE